MLLKQEFLCCSIKIILYVCLQKHDTSLNTYLGSFFTDGSVNCSHSKIFHLSKRSPPVFILCPVATVYSHSNNNETFLTFLFLSHWRSMWTCRYIAEEYMSHWMLMHSTIQACFNNIRIKLMAKAFFSPHTELILQKTSIDWSISQNGASGHTFW